eukprot:SAG31_NODE_39105_length_290_cov_25.534031_1_plen_29_part_10
MNLNLNFNAVNKDLLNLVLVGLSLTKFSI